MIDILCYSFQSAKNWLLTCIGIRTSNFESNLQTSTRRICLEFGLAFLKVSSSSI